MGATPITRTDQLAQDLFSPGVGNLPYSGTVYPSTDGHTADPAPAEFGTLGASSLHVTVIVSAISGAGAQVIVNIEGWDPASSTWVTLLSSVALTATGTTNYRISPWSTTAANTVAQSNLFKFMRIRPVKSGTTTTLQYSVSAHLSA